MFFLLKNPMVLKKIFLEYAEKLFFFQVGALKSNKKNPSYFSWYFLTGHYVVWKNTIQTQNFNIYNINEENDTNFYFLE